ncbi:ParA family protein [Clostridium cochlearium]|uniref:ParA family protein n=1 Tax=Clostridium cochlearium TaxID=1494 RepID=UPI00241E4F3B|nr:ParA family protein [Clostridium cochlearium]MBE6064823.1 ParA family protein [Clostridium cochlearium]
MQYNKRDAAIVSFINMKGGVGKTTLCKEMGNYLSLRYKNKNDEDLKVLLIDIDPQANLTQALNERYRPDYKEYEQKVSIENIFNTKTTGYDIDRIIVKLHKNLDLIPGELETIFLERAQNNNTSHKLMDFIEDNKLKEKYDFIFIDCPPTYSVYTEMAFFCGDYYFIPVIPDAYSALGVDLLERVVADIIYNNRNSIFKDRKSKNIGVIFTRVDLSNKPQQQHFIDALSEIKIIKENNINIFNSQFTESNKLSTSQFEKMLTDREDKKLDNMIDNICSEFLDRVEVLKDEVVNKENQINR